MRFLVALLSLLLMAGVVLAQGGPVGIINGQTPTVGFTTGQCVKVASNKSVTGGACGGASAAVTAASITGGALAINAALGPVFTVTSNANITSFTPSGATAGTATAFEIYFTADGNAYTQAWGSAVKWASGFIPTLTTTNGKRDRFAFESLDGGTTWYASIIGQNY